MIGGPSASNNKRLTANIIVIGQNDVRRQAVEMGMDHLRKSNGANDGQRKMPPELCEKEWMQKKKKTET